MLLLWQSERSLGFSALEPRPPPSLPAPESLGFSSPRAYVFPAFPRLGCSRRQVRFKEGTQAGYGSLLSLHLGQGGMSGVMHFLLQRELYNWKVLEIFRISVQGEWLY